MIKTNPVTAKVGPVREQINAILSSNPTYQEASSKLAELQTKLAKHRSELDQVEAATNADIEQLAARVLDGDSLSDQQAVFSRRDALKQTIKAFELAVVKQQGLLNAAKREVSKEVCAALKPVHLERVERMIAAFDEVSESRAELEALSKDLASSGIDAGNEMPFYGLADIAQIMLRIDHIRNQFWTPFLKGRES